MVDGSQIVAEARAWLGTPFLHQGRHRGLGVDCVGLVAGVAKALQLVDYEVTGYARHPDGVMLRAECERVLRRLAPGEPAREGDVLLFRIARDPQHLGIVTAVAEGRPARMIHAYAGGPGRCVEHGLDARWLRRVVAIYRLPGA